MGSCSFIYLQDNWGNIVHLIKNYKTWEWRKLDLLKGSDDGADSASSDGRTDHGDSDKEERISWVKKGKSRAGEELRGPGDTTPTQAQLDEYKELLERERIAKAEAEAKAKEQAEHNTKEQAEHNTKEEAERKEQLNERRAARLESLFVGPESNASQKEVARLLYLIQTNAEEQKDEVEVKRRPSLDAFHQEELERRLVTFKLKEDNLIGGVKRESNLDPFDQEELTRKLALLKLKQDNSVGEDSAGGSSGGGSSEKPVNQYSVLDTKSLIKDSEKIIKDIEQLEDAKGKTSDPEKQAMLDQDIKVARKKQLEVDQALANLLSVSWDNEDKGSNS